MPETLTPPPSSAPAGAVDRALFGPPSHEELTHLIAAELEQAAAIRALKPGLFVKVADEDKLRRCEPIHTAWRAWRERARPGHDADAGGSAASAAV